MVEIHLYKIRNYFKNFNGSTPKTSKINKSLYEQENWTMFFIVLI